MVKNFTGMVVYNMLMGRTADNKFDFPDDPAKIKAYVENRPVHTGADTFFGAGIKGKVAVAMSHAIPCVVTSASAEGFDVRSGDHMIVVDDEESFADSVISVYTDPVLWNRISRNACGWIEENLSFSAGRRKTSAILDKIGVKSPLPCQ